MGHKPIKQEKIRVLICTIPLKGHYIPILRIAEALASSPEFQVYFATSHHQLPKIQSISSTIVKIDIQDETEEVLREGAWEYIPLYYYDKIWEAQLHRILDKYKPNVIVSDFLTSAVVRVGQALKIPPLSIYLVQFKYFKPSISP